jgi:GMP synthase (glutamine-hydrolysing)
MEAMRNRRQARLLSLVLLLACITLSESWAGDSQRTKSPSNAENVRPWIMVSLSHDLWSRAGAHAQSVIKELSGNPRCIYMHFSKLTLEMVAETKPAFIVLSPQGTPWCRYSGETGVALQNFLWMLPLIAEEMHVPILGICGGHQALALSFGGKVGPIRAAEDDCLPYSHERQSGVVPLTLKASDPIFAGVDGPLRLVQRHYDEVKVLPKGFVLLASDKLCQIQIMRHETKPVYGIQGHPESFSGNRPDGGILIRNFLNIAKAYIESVKGPLREAARGSLFLQEPRQSLRRN